MTEQLTAAIDDAIIVAAHRFDAALELLLVEHDRLEQLAAMREISERLAASSSSPPCPPGTAAEPADRLDTSSSGVSPAAAIPAGPVEAVAAHSAAGPSVGHVPSPPARTAPRAGGTGRDGLTGKQSALLSAVNALGECTAAQVAAHVGRDDVPAVKQGLMALRRRGLIGHNGKPTTLARYLRSTGGGPSQREKLDRAAQAAREPAGLTGSVEQRVELALKWAKRPMTVEAIVSRCKAHGERSKVQEALAYMEADGRAVCDEQGRWVKTERLADAA